MSAIALIVILIALLGSAVFIGYQVKAERRRRRNLERFEKGEPLVKAGEWD